MALGPQSARDRQIILKDNIARAPRQYFTRAAASADLANLVEGQFILAAGRRYRVDEQGPDGLRIVDRTWAGEFEQLQARMQDGQSIRLACYGDSTTDGNGTSGWTPNPTTAGGDAIGTAAHNPPNAWPAVLQALLRHMYANQSLRVWNAGYGGKIVVDGWARRNFATAVINNPGYGKPDIVLLNFGLNDITRQIYTPGLFHDEMVNLLDIMDFYGVVPVIVLPDPVIENTPRQAGSLAELMSVCRRLQARFGLKMIDAHSALTEVFSSGATNSLWAYQQRDNLHFGNGGHRAKASFIAASVFNRTLFVEGGVETVNIAPFSQYAGTQGLTYNVFSEANNRFGANLNVLADTYQAGQALMDVWVWNTTDELDVYWRSVSGDGFYSPRPLANAPEIEVENYLPGVIRTVKSPTAGQVQQPGSFRDSEAPGYIAGMVAGLTRLTFKAPTDSNAYSVFVGYFCLKRTRLPVTFTTYWPSGGDGHHVYDPDVFEARATLAGYGFTRSVRMLMDVAIPDGSGVFLYLGRVFSDGTGGVSQRRSGIVLHRNGANMQILSVTVTSGGIDAVTVLGAAEYTWNQDVNEFIIRLTVGGGNYNIQVTPAATPLSPVLTVSRPVTQAPWSLGGHVGALYMYYGVNAKAGRARCTLYELNQA